jgi:transposase
MFIRKKKKIDPKTGREYFSLQLVESTRTERGPRQRILLNLCAELDFNPDELKSLANRIEEIATGQQSLFPPPEKIETLAQTFATRLVDKLAQPLPQPKGKQQESDYQTIDTNSVEHYDARSIGCEHLLHHVTQQLQLESVLKEDGLTRPQIALALGAIIARAVFPASERASLNWLQTQSGLGELIDFDFKGVSLTHFYRISDVLLKQKEVIEPHIHRRQKDLHGHASTLVLYDLTNTYMEGQAKANPKAKHGWSKEKRTDCPLVTLGLVLDEHGFYIRSKFLPGNVAEPTTLQQAIEDLGTPGQLLRPIVVMDAGIASDDNLRWLRENQFQYVVSARQDAPSMEVVGEMVEANEAGVRVAYVRTEDGEDAWLHCESPAKEATASQMKSLFQKRFEDDLQKIATKLMKPRGNKSLQKIYERIGRVRERHNRISGCYEITVIPSQDGTNAAGIEWHPLAEKMQDKLRGQYFLRTNIKDYDAKALWRLYQTIRSAEDAFRFMKSSLGLRPVYHQKEARVDGHLWITILAYCLIQNLLYQLCKGGGIRERWETIRSYMQSRTRVSMQANTREGKTLHVRTTTRPEGAQKKIYEALSISSTVLRAKKTLI